MTPGGRAWESADRASQLRRGKIGAPASMSPSACRQVWQAGRPQLDTCAGPRSSLAPGGPPPGSDQVFVGKKTPAQLDLCPLIGGCRRQDPRHPAGHSSAL